MASEWFAAAGTLALAGVTVWLVFVTKGMVRKAGEQLALEQKRIAASQRPHVYPAAPHEWTDGAPPYAGTWAEVLPVANGGPGVALNVRGRLRLGNDTHVGFVPTSLGPGSSADLRLNWGGPPNTDHWGDARGYLLYEDVAGITWRTDFHVSIENRRYLVFEWSGELDELGTDPDNDLGIIGAKSLTEVRRPRTAPERRGV